MARNPKPPARKPASARSQRDYGQRSRDPTPRSDEHEWPKFDVGALRTAQGERPRPLGYVHPAQRSSH